MIRPLTTAVTVAAAILLGLIASASFAADVKPLATGAAAPDFDLPGVDGKNHKLADYKDAKVLVVLFTCNHCPTAQAYEDRLIQFHHDYKDKGVALVAINPNDPQAVRLDELGYTDLGDSLEEMKVRAKERNFPFPYLDDGGVKQEVSRAYGALATPHAFVFDGQRKLRYQGRIDDSERDAKNVKSHDLRIAVDALLAGQAPPAEKTNVFGCSTKWSDKRADNEKAIAKWNTEKAELNDIDAKAVKELAENKGDKAPLRLINAWATWCGPCLAEMPELVTMHRMYRKRPFELITITTDDASERAAALGVLNEMHVSAKNYIYAGDNQDALVAALDPEGWQGPVPHTVLIAPGGKILYRAQGQFDAAKLKKAIADYLGRTYASRDKEKAAK